MWVDRIFLPLLEHIVDNIQGKRPGIYFLIEDIIASIKADLLNKTDFINPTVFKQNRKYMLMVLKRK